MFPEFHIMLCLAIRNLQNSNPSVPYLRVSLQDKATSSRRPSKPMHPQTLNSNFRLAFGGGRPGMFSVVLLDACGPPLRVGAGEFCWTADG